MLHEIQNYVLIEKNLESCEHDRDSSVGVAGLSSHIGITSVKTRRRTADERRVIHSRSKRRSNVRGGSSSSTRIRLFASTAFTPTEADTPYISQSQQTSCPESSFPLILAKRRFTDPTHI